MKAVVKENQKFERFECSREEAAKIIAGTARSMGITVEG